MVFPARVVAVGCLIVASAAISGFQPPGRGSSRMEGRLPGELRTVSGFKLRWCPPGKFLMGSPESEPGHRPDESQVEVTLSRGFWMGQFEVTQEEWKRVEGRLPREMEFGSGPDVPVYWVSHLDAERFCDRITRSARASGELPAGWEFGLPTEAQWEYACRAGTTSATAFGDRLTPEQANFGGVSPGKSVAAGSYPPNPWNIFDMHGSVWEYCRDWYHARLPGGTDPDLSAIQGQRNRDGTYSRVRRGGAWIEPGAFCRSAVRLRYEPERSSDHIGFRIALVRR